MQFTLTAIVSLVFVASALGTPITTDTTVAEACNFAGCLTAIGSQTGGIITACGTAAADLARVDAALLAGQTPAQADVIALGSDTVKCVFTSVAAGFAIPAACLSCV